MASGTLIVSDFLAAIKEQRAQAHEIIANLSVDGFVFSAENLTAYEQLHSYPSSKSDALDAALQQVKVVSVANASATAHQAQRDIYTATTGYDNSLKDRRSKDQFDETMQEIYIKTRSSASEALDKSFDKAQEVAQNLSEEEHKVVLDFLDVVVSGFTGLVNKVRDFMVGAIQHFSSWIDGAFENISQAFEKNRGIY